jgi:hypothetical protein
MLMLLAVSLLLSAASLPGVPQEKARWSVDEEFKGSQVLRGSHDPSGS